MAAPVLVYIHTLGCPKNDADSRCLARALSARRVGVAASPEDATHLLINTCGFTQDAKEESIAAILGTADEYPGVPLLVMGCLVERYRADLEAGLPEVRAWYGLGDMERLVLDLSSAGTCEPATDPVVQALEASPVYGYVKISDGCGHGCTFCAIPAIKGPYHALPLVDILAQADACLSEGARELVLVGQDTAIWRDDGLDLIDLVDRLAQDERVAWIRLMYLQPEHVDGRLLESMAAHPKLCRYLDMPFQHAARSVLERMGRRGDGAQHLDLLARARALMPDVSLRSTFIAGFPGETEEDVDELLEFAAAAGFDHAGAFLFSPEEGTAAARLRPRVPKRRAIERLNRLNDVLTEAAETAASAREGREVDVLVESLDPEDDWPEEAAAVGRARSQAPEVDGQTFLESPLPLTLRVGDIVPAVVSGSLGHDLLARCHVAP